MRILLVIFSVLATACGNGANPAQPGPATEAPRAGESSDDDTEPSPAARRPVAPSGPAAPREETFLLGIISDDPAAAYERYGNVAQAFAAAAGRRRGDVVPSTHFDRIIGDLCSGGLDAVLDTASTAFVAQQRCGAKYSLIAAKRGSLRYRSAIIVATDSPARSLTDLRGKLVLFEDPTSTSAYVLPRAMLDAAGLRLVQLGQTAVPDDVRYDFAGGELNIIGRVVHKAADAGGLSSDDISRFGNADIRVLAESDPVPRLIVATSPALPPELVTQIQNRMIAADGRNSGVDSTARVAGFELCTAADEEVVNRVGLQFTRSLSGARP